MAMLTRCAACSTTFRITAEQLVSRQGKVRCGACGEVFSALQNLLHSRDGAEPAVSKQETSDRPPPATAAELTIPSITTASLILHAPVATVAEVSREAETLVTAAIATDAANDAAADAPVAIVPPPSRKKIAWWSLIGMMLAATVLSAQAVYFYRDETAARFPEAKPWLERLCQHASCKLEAPRDAQAISIESSDLQADPANRSLLTLVALLRNRASFDQEVPHLELALTDAQDALVARRVLLPRDYAASAQFSAGAEIQMRLVIDAGQLKASGYRLYAFYP